MTTATPRLASLLPLLSTLLLFSHSSQVTLWKHHSAHVTPPLESLQWFAVTLRMKSSVLHMALEVFMICISSLPWPRSPAFLSHLHHSPAIFAFLLLLRYAEQVSASGLSPWYPSIWNVLSLDIHKVTSATSVGSQRSPWGIGFYLSCSLLYLRA